MSSDRDAESPPQGFLLPQGMTAAEFTRQAATLPELPVDQPPPADMPPVTLMVLDSLADDAETIYTMRNCGDMAPYGVALVGESHLLAAVRPLLKDGLIEVENEYAVIDGRLVLRSLADRARTADEHLRRYWFRMTPAGEATWQEASDVLDAYRRASARASRRIAVAMGICDGHRALRERRPVMLRCSSPHDSAA